VTDYPVAVRARLDEPLRLAVAGEVDSDYSARRRAGVPVARLPGRVRDRLLRHSLHRHVPPGDVRLQRRCAAVDLAGRLIRVRCPWHRPISAVHAGRRPQLLRPFGDPLPRRAVPRPGVGQVVAVGDPASVDHRRVHHRKLRGGRGDSLRRAVVCPDAWAEHLRPHRRSRGVVHVPLSARAVRFRHGDESLGERQQPDGEPEGSA
jgi:hypothetical protein